MSNLLEQASLVMIPSGYKEDIVYSVIPTSGAGDLSFTRASNGTRINSAGLVEDVPWNLLEYSEDFTNGYWTKFNATVTANSIAAPNGTTTADLITSTGTNETGIYTLPSFDGSNTWSVYAKKGTGRYLFFNTNSPVMAAKFDLEDGVIVGTPSVGASPSIESIGNGWYKCIITSSTATNRFTLFITNNTTTDNLDSSVGLTCYIWGAQVNAGALKPYFPTTDRLNVPRLTYQNGGGGCPSLLLEKQSTNVLRNSEDFSQSTWAKLRTSISANAIISPDGTQNADKAIANTDNSDHSLFDNTITSSSPATFSIYAKAGEYNYIFLGYDNGLASQGAFFNLSNGTISQNTSTLTASIQSVGNGWYRCVVSSGTSNWGTIYSIIALSENGTSFIFAGDGSKGIYIWGAQAEASSYSTSYIQTTSSSATRVADECYKTGISSLIGATEGVIFVDFNNVTNPEAGDYNMLATISDSANDYIYISKRNPTGIEIYGGAGASTYITSGVFVDGQRYKVALAYKNNDFAVYINGTSIWTDTSGTINFTTPNKFSLGSYYSQILNFNSGINQAALFKTRLTNSELAQLTGNQNYTINQAYASYGVASESPNCVQP